MLHSSKEVVQDFHFLTCTSTNFSSLSRALSHRQETAPHRKGMATPKELTFICPCVWAGWWSSFLHNLPRLSTAQKKCLGAHLNIITKKKLESREVVQQSDSQIEKIELKAEPFSIQHVALRLVWAGIVYPLLPRSRLLWNFIHYFGNYMFELKGSWWKEKNVLEKLVDTVEWKNSATGAVWAYVQLCERAGCNLKQGLEQACSNIPRCVA